MLISLQIKFHTNNMTSTQTHNVNLAHNRDSLRESKQAHVAEKVKIERGIECKTREVADMRAQKGNKYIK